MSLAGLRDRMMCPRCGNRRAILPESSDLLQRDPNFSKKEYGDGFPLIWVHEFAGSMESWLPQVNFFSRRYRVSIGAEK